MERVDNLPEKRKKTIEHVMRGIAREIAHADALVQAGNYQAAAEQYRRILAKNPSSGVTYAKLGSLFRRIGNNRMAAISVRKAIALDPRLADAHANLGALLREEQRLGDALESYSKAHALAPGNGYILYNIGLCLTDLGLLGKAEEHYRDALKTAPDCELIWSNYCYSLCFSHGPADWVAAEHCRWGGRYDAPANEWIDVSGCSPDPDRPLRIGYVSPDFRTHSVAYFLEPLIREHGDEFTIYCYSNCAREDAVTERFRTLADVWRPVHAESDAQVAARIRQDRIDVLVDCAGHTEGNRLGVFGLRPAPVQASWCGYPATTGLAAIDYRITDSIADPPGYDRYYREVLWRLDPCFLSFMADHDAPPVAAAPGKQDRPFTFGSFNKLGKISEETILCWAAIMRAVPNSRLLLKAEHLGNPLVQQRIQRAFGGSGVDPDRLSLVEYVESRYEHLALYAQVDLCLDTFPYAGTTTTCEALWMGAPVLTLRGDRHVSRVGASLLGALDLEELVAESKERYVQLAVSFAGKPETLAHLRVTMRERMRGSVLCDVAGFARRMEKAYRDMWRTCCELSQRFPGEAARG